MRRHRARAAEDALALFDRLAAPTIGGVAAFALAGETRAPLRHRTAPRRQRWKANLIVGAIAALFARLAVVPTMVHVAARSERRSLLAWLGLPRGLRAISAFVLLDYSMYAWHRANHQVPLLWRFHSAHHVDPDVDVTTALRFHFIELVLSIPVRCAVIAALGIPPRGVVVYECMMHAAATFHHANVRLPPKLERLLSKIIVTPTLHGTHHSDRPDLLSSNWGVVLSAWDYLHGTRRLTAQDTVRIGVPSQPAIAIATHPFWVLLGPCWPLRRRVDSP